ncbi:fatty acid desaturase [Pseudomonas fontis]|uniref:Fatty acid desaturase n=1 Tax=Pseudomonas fontis TaxID=2942633 RepID=A0ABT5NRH0_9PSED|nr:fatty acid desaturase [Pseudomonas fontis]MDD0976654.1 fatty acid desaturase [Pseudomonas fontis]MDD0990766.1 fatty acid desaturase [Pseudomonas fontis]
MSIDWAVIVIALWSACYFDHWALYLLAWLVVGNRQHALTVLGHEGVHRLISHNHKLNDLLSNVFCFWPMTMSVHGFRKFHLYHHRFCKTEQDPERDLFEMKYFSLPLSRNGLLFRVLKDLLGFGAWDTRYVLDKMSAPKRMDRVMPYLFLTVLSAIFIGLSLWEVPLLWFVSMVTSQFAITRLRTWTEHTGTVEAYKFTAHPVILHAIYPHNIWIHYEHHHYPLIPYYNLPAARAKYPEHVQSFTQVYRHIFKLDKNEFSADPVAR